MQDKKDKNNNLDFFSLKVKNKLENFELPVDDHCWEEIEGRLANKKKKFVLWPWISGVAVSIAILTIIFITPTFTGLHPGNEIVQKGNNIDKDIAVEPKLNNQDKNKDFTDNTIIEVDNAVIISGNKQIISPNIIENKSKTPAKEMTITENNETAKEQSLNNKEDDLISDNNSKDEVIQTKEVSKQKEETLITEENPYKDWKPIKKRKQDGWLLSLAAGSENSVSTSFQAFGTESSMNNSIDRFEERPNSLKNKPIREDFSDVHHLLPLTFGLKVRKNFNRYFAVESGLTYTYLSSKYENDGIQRKDAVSKTHYLGIPLSGVVYFINNPKWNLYFSAGATMEKGIWSVYSLNTYLLDIPENETTSGSVKGLQWSLNASIGISYSFYRNFSLYFEPRAIYYFDNDQPASARTERPFNLGLNAGIRYTIN